MTSPDIIKVISSNRPNLSMSSLRTYSSIIRNLCKDLELPHDEKKLADNYKKIIERFKESDPKTRKTRLAAVLVYIIGTKNDKAIDHIRESMMSDSSIVRKQEESQEMTEREKRIFSDFSWRDVIAKVEELGEKVKGFGEKLSKKEFRICQEYVILRCMTDIPPRRSLDWVKFAIRDYDEKDQDVNFMRISTEKIKRKTIKKYQFVFREYKTKKVYGEQVLDIPDSLGHLIEWWRTRNPHKWLLMNVSQTSPLSQVQLSHMLNDVFGRNISTSALRHLYLMDKYSEIDDEQKEDAKYMGHSTQEQKNYILKK